MKRLLIPAIAALMMIQSCGSPQTLSKSSLIPFPMKLKHNLLLTAGISVMNRY